ncbi:ELO family [Fimicolochytrium jonesii]|uniref:ELO family n=1 Tax=Fimicolochytrium jonesii TaxID=1396493 RepID=UPI0022FE7A17|nr:ELO family [Fimicolochytrium jonesii]KAI8820952.1 ELO family [Fimicolochytrium jonesii]
MDVADNIKPLSSHFIPLSPQTSATHPPTPIIQRDTSKTMTYLTSPFTTETPPPLTQFYDQLVDWRTPVFTALIYVVTVKRLAKGIKGPPPSSTSDHWTNHGAFKAFVVLHNALLAVFSGVTFVGMARDFYANLRDRDLVDALCDRNEQFWNASLFYWAFPFYLSKYYEIVDTAILLMKGRKPSLLQTYHHAGAIISMWLCIRGRTTAVWIFVLFNSFIHTLMYTYYILTTLSIHPPRSIKQTLTSMQIGQFIIGLAISLFNPTLQVAAALFPQSRNALTCLKGPEVVGRETAGYEVAAHVLMTMYLVPLMALFRGFARRTYGKTKKA